MCTVGCACAWPEDPATGIRNTLQPVIDKHSETVLACLETLPAQAQCPASGDRTHDETQTASQRLCPLVAMQVVKEYMSISYSPKQASAKAVAHLVADDAEFIAPTTFSGDMEGPQCSPNHTSLLLHVCHMNTAYTALKSLAFTATGISTAGMLPAP